MTEKELINQLSESIKRTTNIKKELFSELQVKRGLRNDDGSSMNAIKLRATPNERSITKFMRVRAVYTVGINHYMGSQRLEIKINAIEPV